VASTPGPGGDLCTTIRYDCGQVPLTEDPLAQDILRSIRQLVRGISIHSKQLLRDVGLTIPQVLCLRAIEKLAADGVDLTVVEVSEAVQLSPATVSRIIDRLLAAGLVARERSSIDRRKVQVSLTDAGRARLMSVPVPLQETFLQQLFELSLDERKVLLASLRTLVDLMNAGHIDAAPLLAPGDNV
jgi:DNA-binding MarR family transcriptional regulator